ncbi:MAG: hypothetical protein H5U40_16330 [Polyangiaceae bacterium]|nr:hypothetical protein [Polyangiaceae bacterium]
MLLAPALALAFAALVSVLHGLGRYRIVMIALSCAAWLLPAIFEWAGWLPSAYRFDEGVMTILPNITDLPETLVRPGLIAVNFATTAAVCGLLWRYSAWVAESRERLHLHAWHLENIAPSEQRERSPRSEPPPAPLDVTRH